MYLFLTLDKAFKLVIWETGENFVFSQRLVICKLISRVHKKLMCIQLSD